MYFGPCETDELRSVNSCETDAICVLYKRLFFKLDDMIEKVRYIVS